MCPSDDPADDDDPAPPPPPPPPDDKTRAGTALSVRELVLFEGDHLPPLSAARVLRLGAAAIEPLIDILVDSELRDPSGPGASFGPVHAATLLGQLGAQQAVEPLLDTLATTEPPSELYVAVSQALAPLGAALVSPILDRLPTAVGTYRQELWVLLAGAKVHDERILDQLLESLAEQPAEGAMRLAEYGDPEALPHLTRALDAYRPGLLDDDRDDRIVFELAEAIEDLGGTLTPTQARKVEHARLTRRAENSLKNRRELPADAPCKCGSGQKYRSCCLQ